MTGDTPQQPIRRRGVRRVLRWLMALVAVFAVAAICATVGAYLAYDYTTRPRPGGDTVRIEVPQGATGADVAEILAREGLIEHALFFRLALRLDPSPVHIQHGQYDLRRNHSPMQLLDALQMGPLAHFDPAEIPDDHKFSVPEGLSIQQMAAYFDDTDAFLEAVRDPGLRARLGIDAETLEGYLAPNTYYFDAPPSAEAVVERMVAQFEQDWEELIAAIPDAANRDRHEVVTIASLIEEEARVPEERPLVAAVIYNRLERGMPLDLDSTLQYALNKYGQRMLDADKDVESPYNTYRNPGLPPGPICNPGFDSLRAALEPADADYLFFVSNADGKTHTFSSTIAEHNRAVARYRREIAEQRRQLRQP